MERDTVGMISIGLSAMSYSTEIFVIVLIGIAGMAQGWIGGQVRTILQVERGREILDQYTKVFDYYCP